jgi:hypothetical protein
MHSVWFGGYLAAIENYKNVQNLGVSKGVQSRNNGQASKSLDMATLRI